MSESPLSTHAGKHGYLSVRNGVIGLLLGIPIFIILAFVGSMIRSAAYLLPGIGKPPAVLSRRIVPIIADLTSVTWLL